MKRFAVDWSKTYYASGTVYVTANSEEEAERMALDELGDYTGNMQYDPNEDYVEAIELPSIAASELD